MNLHKLSDEDLNRSAENLAGTEREVLTQMLHHLREIERRRLFSKLKYKSLFDYAVKHLKYSADQAGRRIAAMRLLRDLPALEEKIESGSLSLTNLSMAQSLFRKEAFSAPEKMALIEQIENKSTRDAEKIVIAQASRPILLRPDRVRAVAPQFVEYKFTADEQLAAKIDRIKGLLAHKKPNCSMAELFSELCDIGIEKLSPRPPKARQFHSQTDTKQFTSCGLDHHQEIKAKRNEVEKTGDTAPLGAPKGHCVNLGTKSHQRNSARMSQQSDSQGLQKQGPTRKTIPLNTKRMVWQSSKGECQNCGSIHALEFDHIQPVSLGGTNEENNLRLLCRLCNQRAAIDRLGLKKMKIYF